MTGSFANNADALAIKAFAISPSRWACLASSVSNVSNIPKVEGPNCRAYHLTVSGSPSARGNALFKKASTSFSLPFGLYPCQQCEFFHDEFCLNANLTNVKV